MTWTDLRDIGERLNTYNKALRALDLENEDDLKPLSVEVIKFLGQQRRVVDDMRAQLKKDLMHCIEYLSTPCSQGGSRYCNICKAYIAAAKSLVEVL